MQDLSIINKDTHFPFFENFPVELTCKTLGLLNLNSILVFSQTCKTHRTIPLGDRKIVKQIICQNLLNAVKEIPKEMENEKFNCGSFVSFLVSVVYHVVKSHPAQAKKLAETIDVKSNRSEALSYIVMDLAQTDPLQAYDQAQTIKNWYYQEIATASTLKKIASTSPEKAIDLIEKNLKNEHKKSQFLLNTLKILAKTNPKRAMELSTKMTKWDQVNLYLFLAERHVDTNHSLASEYLNKANEVADTMEFGVDHISRKCNIIKIEGKINTFHKEERTRILISRIKKIDNSNQKLRVIPLVSKILPATNVNFTQEIINDLLKEISNMKDADIRKSKKEEAYKSLSKAQGKIDPEKAIFNIVTLIKDGTTRSLALFSIFDRLKSVDLNLIEKTINHPLFKDYRDTLTRDACIGLANTNPEKAIKMAKTIQKEPVRHAAFFMMVKEFMKTNPEKAIELAKTIEDQKLQSEAFSSIAKELVKTDPTKGSEVAHEIKHFRIKLETLISIHAFVFEDDPELAQKNFSFVINEANTIQNPKDKALLLLSLAEQA